MAVSSDTGTETSLAQIFDSQSEIYASGDDAIAEIKKDSVKKVITENPDEPKKVKSGNAKFFPNIDNDKKILNLFFLINRCLYL